MNGWLARLIGMFAVEKPIVKPITMITLEKFSKLTGIVIDNFEGGYYHPDMLKNFKPSDQAKLKASGETMFGLDRKAGAQLAKYPEWKTFWAALDAAKAANPQDFKYNKRGGVAGVQLKILCAAIMYQWFSSLFNKYITSAGQTVVENDDRLIIHFSYASWNGEGWFKRFAATLNAAASNPATDREKIFTAAIEARTKSSNVVIRQQGVNMMAAFKKLGYIV